MITAVDTSVLLDIFAADPKHVTRSQSALRDCLREGALIACEVVVAELRPCFRNRESLLQALATIEVAFSPVSCDAALLAGETWAKYRKTGGSRDRLIPDFIVAAHAQDAADRLLTRDRGFYKRWFRSLDVLEP